MQKLPCPPLPVNSKLFNIVYKAVYYLVCGASSAIFIILQQLYLLTFLL